MARTRIVIIVVIGGFVLACMAGALTFALPPATEDERAVLTKIARSMPVTTCLAFRTVAPSGYRANWTGSPLAPEFARAHGQSRARDVALALDAESLVDNALKIECRDSASLSTPGFVRNLAFVEVTSQRERQTFVLRKAGGRWNIVARTGTRTDIPVV